ncbi:MAG: DUF2807 domain-containing protein [Pseudoflavonifractor sp.]|nr:DUF2807 domain-containing protein [Alloprevotella sp.]MCM1117166.1 DUF2807 domain-containing protein [Pseudoflavonifractor sp.]
MTLRYMMLPMLALMLSALNAFAGSPSKYDLKVNDFTELKIVDDINVIYRCSADSAGHVTFTALPDQASAFIFQPDGNKIELQLAPEAVSSAPSLPIVTIYSTFLTRAENNGSGRLVIESVAPAPKLQLVLVGNGRIMARNLSHPTIDASIRTGNGEIVLGGKSELVKLSSLGSGTIQADELIAREAKCRITGTGSIGVNASDALTISGLGSGTVYYLGKPTIKNRTVGVKTAPLTR